MHHETFQDTVCVALCSTTAYQFSRKKSKCKTCVLQNSTVEVSFSDIVHKTASSFYSGQYSHAVPKSGVVTVLSFLPLQIFFFFHSKLIGILNRVSKCITPTPPHPQPRFLGTGLKMNYKPCSNSGEDTYFTALEKTAVSPYFLVISY